MLIERLSQVDHQARDALALVECLTTMVARCQFYAPGTLKLVQEHITSPWFSNSEDANTKAIISAFSTFLLAQIEDRKKPLP